MRGLRPQGPKAETAFEDQDAARQETIDDQAWAFPKTRIIEQPSNLRGNAKCYRAARRDTSSSIISDWAFGRAHQME
jgi:hypothetical protein